MEPLSEIIYMWLIWQMHTLRLCRNYMIQKGFVCNLGTGKGSSVLEVIHAFKEANDISIPYEFAPRRSGDVTEAWANQTWRRI